jgi:tetratricopeptide (TPR) repeat protein
MNIRMFSFLPPRLLAGFLACLLLGGCLAPQTKALRTMPPVATAPVELKDVPFLPQDDHLCGPAALATLLQYSGRDIKPEQLTEQVYVPGRAGSFAVEMVAAARQQGRLVYPIAPHLSAVLTALEQGYPVLVLQNNGLGIYPVWHYAVVVGADQAQEKLWLRSGRSERLEMSFSSFERTWARSQYWGVLVLDPTRIPESLDAPAVVRELALMEKVGAVTDAQAGFSRSVLNWPQQKTAWLGLASSSLKLGEPERAESTLRELVRREPGYGPGLNNLADLLLRTGRAKEALPFAERAVAVLDIPQTRGTLAAIHESLQTAAASTQIPFKPGIKPDVKTDIKADARTDLKPGVAPAP